MYHNGCDQKKAGKIGTYKSIINAIRKKHNVRCDKAANRSRSTNILHKLQSKIVRSL